MTRKQTLNLTERAELRRLVRLHTDLVYQRDQAILRLRELHDARLYIRGETAGEIALKREIDACTDLIEPITRQRLAERFGIRKNTVSTLTTALWR